MAIRRFILYAAGAIDSSTLFGSSVVNNAAMADNAIGSAEIADDAVGASEIATDAVAASELDEAANYNITGDLQVDGVNVAVGTGSLYYIIVDAASTTTIANYATGAPNTLDGVSLSTGMDVLYWHGTTGNGILNVDVVGSGSNGEWSRPADRDAAGELPVGALVYVKAGNAYGQRLFKLTTFAGTLGSDALTFEEHQEGLTPAGSEPYVVGTGNGSTLTFDLIASGIVYCAIIVGGVPQPPDIYSISAGTGTGGVDQVVFTSGNAPTDGAAIEMIAFLRS